MQRWMEALRGYVEVEVVSLFPERALNLCMQHRIRFWDLEWRSAQCFVFKLSRRDWPRFQKVAKRFQGEIRVMSRRGLPQFWGRFRGRTVLKAGLALCLAMLIGHNFFLWEIDVTGLERIPEPAFRAALEEAGVKRGAFGLGIHPELVKSRVLPRFDDLLWLTVNVTGARAVVIARERREHPPVLDPRQPSNVVAEQGGILLHQEVYEGSAQFREGDTVARGELLVSGITDVQTGGVRFVHADARVWARTFREVTAVAPLETQQRQYTGETETKRALLLGKRRINFYGKGGISFVCCDKMKETKQLTLPGGLELPVWLICERYRAYEAAPAAPDPAGEQARLEQALLAALEADLEDGEVLKTEFFHRVEGGLLQVTLKAECREEIGRTVAIPEGEVLRIPNDNDP